MRPDGILIAFGPADYISKADISPKYPLHPAKIWLSSKCQEESLQRTARWKPAGLGRPCGTSRPVARALGFLPLPARAGLQHQANAVRGPRCSTFDL